MDIFEYLPQLIVAYDGNDEFANLIHVKKTNKDIDYFCPCCGGIVKPMALDSTKEQSHYYHITGKCTKESQLHFFCKNWLFEKGSKFYLEDILYEVDFIDIEKIWNTPFGDYKPDISVYTTTGEIIYFEMFFANRKTEDDYFCKWDYLKNDVVEVDIKEYMFKTDENIIPSFTYLFHNRVCFSKPYIKRDLYANTIARIKHELTRQKVLNYKARIEQLDWFWQKIRNSKSREEILNTIANMEYDDMVSCYDIIKRKQCVSYLKNDVLDVINKKVISEIRSSLDLPYDENVYFDLRHVKGRTYEAGIRLNLKTEHIIYNKLFEVGKARYRTINRLVDFPKIVFSKNILNKNEIAISDKDIAQLKETYSDVCNLKENLLKYDKSLSNFENNIYRIRMNNDLYTVLSIFNSNTELLFENKYISSLDIDKLSEEIKLKISENKNDKFLKDLFSSNDYNNFIQEIKTYKNFNVDVEINKSKKYIRFRMYIARKCFYDEKLDNNLDDFNKKKNDCILLIQNFMEKYYTILYLVKRINNCKNNFWESDISFDFFGDIIIKIDQKYFTPKRHLTFEKIYFDDILTLTEKEIISQLEKAMYKVIKNMERCGCRVMEVND
ncbi:hypothetical protein C823_007587 [Eubacterium plexicaudatum ASF492]|uniref:Uncharacterized protein n=1 Tax=Eubacterium plexicaudatum ASF492 TaxID=1235802 RepID=N1ZWJ8_9FIRM|nr:hypothetical protein C823_007587 [Eubacterium plexicaudatum ASF492]